MEELVDCKIACHWAMLSGWSSPGSGLLLKESRIDLCLLNRRSIVDISIAGLFVLFGQGLHLNPIYITATGSDDLRSF